MPEICVLGDRSKNLFPPHVHPAPGCHCNPMPMGPSITASANVYAAGQPVMRVGDKGIHEPGYTCCGPNTWVVTAASGGVLVNGAAIVRVGDWTSHCGTTFGEMQGGG